MEPQKPRKRGTSKERHFQRYRLRKFIFYGDFLPTKLPKDI